MRTVSGISEDLHKEKGLKMRHTYSLSMLCVMFCLLGKCDMRRQIDNSVVKGTGSDKNVVTNLSTNIAIEIAEAKLCQVYGKRVLRQRPWKIKYIGDNILITGTLHRDGESNRKGGVAQISINRHDGRIIKVTHGK